MAFIRGEVDFAGNIKVGTGYTVTFNPDGAGTYCVNFDTPFPKLPVVLVSAQATSSTQDRFATIYSTELESFSVAIWKPRDTERKNTGFTFSVTDSFGG